MNLIMLAACLGLPENSVEFLGIVSKIEESPEISEDPAGYNDPEGRTKYYSFPFSGILFGFRNEMLDHVHIYITSHEGYKPYSGGLMDSLNNTATEKDIVSLLGLPERSGGGVSDKLIGYIYKWMRYHVNDRKIRFEFMENGRVRKITLKTK